MKLEKQVCLVEQSKRLKELGVEQKSIWKWVAPVNENMISSNYGLYHYAQADEIVAEDEDSDFKCEAYSAFTLCEAAVMLPDLIETTRQYELIFIKEYNDCWICRYVRNNDMTDNLCSKASEYAVIAACDMLIMLIQDKVISIEDVNIRLNS